jgi:hypothetical protein
MKYLVFSATRFCKECNKEFIAYNGMTRYCSIDCKKIKGLIRLENDKLNNPQKYIDREKRYKKTSILKKIKLGQKILSKLKYNCKICGKKYKPKAINSLYCSKKCSKQNEKNKYKLYINTGNNRKKISIRWNRWYRKYINNKFKKIIKCKCCGKKFFRRQKRQLYCKNINCKRKMWTIKAREDNIKNYIRNKQKRKEKYIKQKNKKSNYYISLILRAGLRCRLKKNNIKKTLNYEQLLGCTIEEFKKWLELNFKDKMNWKNYGFYGWHIDHTIPCCKFNLKDEREQKICFHFTNMLPMWGKENLSKGGRFNYETVKN